MYYKLVTQDLDQFKSYTATTTTLDHVHNDFLILINDVTLASVGEQRQLHVGNLLWRW
jgi:hypothetical protein